MMFWLQVFSEGKLLYSQEYTSEFTARNTYQDLVDSCRDYPDVIIILRQGSNEIARFQIKELREVSS